GFVERSQEQNGIEIFLAAVAVGNPFTFLPRVIEIEHRRDGIDAQAVDVVLVEPEQAARQKEGADFITAVVENRAVPFGMEALTRVCMLVQMRAVEVSETVRVAGEV